MIKTVALIILLVSPALAERPTGASFLRIGTGARPAALGGAYTALAVDINALYYNPAGLAALTRREFGATHAEWLLNTRFDFVGFAQPTTYGTLGLGVTRLSSGRFDSRDANGRQSGGFTASDTAYAVSFARGAMGGSLKLLRSDIAGYTAQAVAVDLGARKALSSYPLTFGAAVLNLGQGMRFLDQVDPLPLTLALGTSYRVAGTLAITLDARREIHAGRFDFGVGSEYALLPALSLRAGYASRFDGTTTTTAGGILGGLGGLGAGFGLTMKSYRADYTFTPFGALGNVQRLSLGARW